MVSSPGDDPGLFRLIISILHNNAFFSGKIAKFVHYSQLSKKTNYYYG